MAAEGKLIKYKDSGLGLFRPGKMLKRSKSSLELSSRLVNTKDCTGCNKRFDNKGVKRSYCRKCGKVFCFSCIDNRIKLDTYYSQTGGIGAKLKKTTLHRVCDDCAGKKKDKPNDKNHKRVNLKKHNNKNRRKSRMRHNTLEKYQKVALGKSNPFLEVIMQEGKDEKFKTEDAIIKKKHEELKNMQRVRSESLALYSGKRAVTIRNDFFSNVNEFTSKFLPVAQNQISNTDEEKEDDINIEELLEESDKILKQQLKELKESEKKLLNQRLDEIKKISKGLIQTQNERIKKSTIDLKDLINQMRKHAEQLTARIQNRATDDVKSTPFSSHHHAFEDMRLKDELSQTLKHIGVLELELAMPKFMKWKLRAKAEENMFVGFRDIDLDKLECSFNLSNDNNGVLFEVNNIDCIIGVYEFLLTGNSAKAKVLNTLLTPSSSNRIDVHIGGKLSLPLRFRPADKKHPVSYWEEDTIKRKPNFEFLINKTQVAGATVFQLPDKILQWLANSLLPSIIINTIKDNILPATLGPFLTQKTNIVLIEGSLQIKGDSSPNLWKSTLVGPSLSSREARRQLGISEEEAALLDTTLRGPLAKAAGFKNKAISLARLHKWRLYYASHPISALKELLTLIQNDSPTKIPDKDWISKIITKVCNLARKPINLHIQLTNFTLDVDLRELVHTVTEIYLQSIQQKAEEASAVEEQQKRVAEAKSKKNKESPQKLAAAAAIAAASSAHAESLARVAKQTVERTRSLFDQYMIPLLNDSFYVKFNALLIGGEAGLVAFNLSDLKADVRLPNNFEFERLLFEDGFYEGSTVRLEGEATDDASYKLKFTNLDSTHRKLLSVTDLNDAEITLNDINMNLFRPGRPKGSMLLTAHFIQVSILLQVLISRLIVNPTNDENGDDSLNLNNSHEQITPATRLLLEKSKKLMDNVWGSLKNFADQVPQKETNDHADFLLPYLTDDRYELHLDLRGLTLSLKKYTDSNNKPTIRIIVEKQDIYQQNQQFGTFHFRQSLQEVFD